MMYRLFVLIFLFQTPVVLSQRIFYTSGIMVSHLHLSKSYYSSYYDYHYDQSMSLDPIVSTSISVGYETKQWHRFSIAATASNFNSGGKISASLPYVSNGKRVTFNNTCLGASVNYYIINRKTQFYIGIGPRIDYLKPDYEMYNLLEYYEDRPLHIFKPGLSGSIGFNYQVGDFSWGLKSNYYYRFGNTLELTDSYSSGSGYESYHKVVKDFAYDLQFILGYQFGKKKKAEHP